MCSAYGCSRVRSTAVERSTYGGFCNSWFYWKTTACSTESASRLRPDHFRPHCSRKKKSRKQDTTGEKEREREAPQGSVCLYIVMPLPVLASRAPSSSPRLKTSPYASHTLWPLELLTIGSSMSADSRPSVLSSPSV
ncbi:hypothetical protein BGW36DRAFT_211622 [Talaromyces proteolyticus]|uniref:Uncharacterized protein n=1 Tax=Talaromyces proteolyticus TaxID=1131652 RepID=A0AAD4PVS0_9EURO|nr:uncharacterized protein BGW36DRAFT_211622 [Talaromyces proteolyticus]KAH8693817.1 hypothetical protein BGW36DRAFT_211622 [Talaromyces proteolyticus]